MRELYHNFQYFSASIFLGIQKGRSDWLKRSGQSFDHRKSPPLTSSYNCDFIQFPALLHIILVNDVGRNPELEKNCQSFQELARPGQNRVNISRSKAIQEKVSGNIFVAFCPFLFHAKDRLATRIQGICMDRTIPRTVRNFLKIRNSIHYLLSLPEIKVIQTRHQDL
jgi:hypothetical protein